MDEVFQTFKGLFEHVSHCYCSPKAVNGKRAGTWNCTSSTAFKDEVSDLSRALLSLGVRKGDSIGILGTPSPTWLAADLSIMAIGAVSVPFFPDEPADILQFKLKDSKTRRLFLLAGADHAAVESCLACLDTIICEGTWNGAKQVIGIDRFRATGRIWSGNPSDSIISEADLATIIYTSGSTGTSKGVELSHRNLISQIHASHVRFPLTADDVALSCLPLAHSFERMLIYYYLASGVPIYFNSDITRLGEDLREIQPTIMTVVPRILEKVHAKLAGRLDDSNPLRRMTGRAALRRAMRRDPASGPGILDSLADRLIFSKFRASLGGNLKYVITGGSALPAALYRFFVNAGIPLYQGYGLTEASPVLSTNFPGHHRIGTVGQSFPGVKIQLGPDGEILAKGPNITRGYHNLPAATAELIDRKGWLHTGDLGEIDSEGFITITGRVKELFKTSCGEYVAPRPIEQALSATSLVDMAMVIGENRKFVSCLLFPDLARLNALKKDHGDASLSEAEFLESSYMKRRMNSLLKTVNAHLEHWEQVREYRFILEPPSVQTGVLTPTMKLKRHVVLEKYKDVIESLYEEKVISSCGRERTGAVMERGLS